MLKEGIDFRFMKGDGFPPRVMPQVHCNDSFFATDRDVAKITKVTPYILHLPISGLTKLLDQSMHTQCILIGQQMTAGSIGNSQTSNILCYGQLCFVLILCQHLYHESLLDKSLKAFDPCQCQPLFCLCVQQISAAHTKNSDSYHTLFLADIKPLKRGKNIGVSNIFRVSRATRYTLSAQVCVGLTSLPWWQTTITCFYHEPH